MALPPFFFPPVCRRIAYISVAICNHEVVILLERARYNRPEKKISIRRSEAANTKRDEKGRTAPAG